MVLIFVRYPVEINISVTESIDDVEEVRNTGLVYTDSSDLELVDDPSFAGLQSAVGIRFRNVPLDPYTIVISARITFTADETDSTTANLRIFAEAADNAAEFTSVLNPCSSFCAMVLFVVLIVHSHISHLLCFFSHDA